MNFDNFVRCSVAAKGLLLFIAHSFLPRQRMRVVLFAVVALAAS